MYTKVVCALNKDVVIRRNRRSPVVSSLQGHYQGCKSQAWRIGPGRSGQQISVDWAGPAGRARILAGPSRAGPFSANIPRRFRQYLPFFERTILNLKWLNNKIKIFFKKSFQNTDRKKIQHDRPRISAGPGRAVTARDFSWAEPGRTVRPSPARRLTTLGTIIYPWKREIRKNSVSPEERQLANLRIPRLKGFRIWAFRSVRNWQTTILANRYGPALKSIWSTWDDYQMLNCTRNLIECKFFFICRSTFCVGFKLLTIRDLSELILRERLN